MADTPTPRWTMRFGRLDTLVRVRKALARVVRAAGRGEIPTPDAARIGTLLDQVRRCLVDQVLEERVSALEELRKIEGRGVDARTRALQ